MLRRFIPLFMVLLTSISAKAQNREHEKVYRFNYKWEVAATAVGYGLNYWGLGFIKRQISS